MNFLGTRGRHFLIFLSLVVWGCATAPVETTESGPPAALESSVLIVTQKTKFKQEVVSEVRKALNQNSIHTKIVDVKNLRSQDTRDFSAIVIINRALAGRPDPRVESYIDYEPQKNKIIILTTGILDAWKPDTEGVDAMTSASVISKSDKSAIIKRPVLEEGRWLRAQNLYSEVTSPRLFRRTDPGFLKLSWSSLKWK